jgi:hypothetical protein
MGFLFRSVESKMLLDCYFDQINEAVIPAGDKKLQDFRARIRKYASCSLPLMLFYLFLFFFFFLAEANKLIATLVACGCFAIAAFPFFTLFF